MANLIYSSFVAFSMVVTGSYAVVAADLPTTHVTEPIKKSPQKIVDAPKVPIRMWTSRDGGKKQDHILEEVDIGGLYFDGLLAYDIQYESTLRFRGLKLRDLISQYKPIPDGIDYLLLHSKQGMIIPVAISSLRQDTEVFIALAVYDDAKKDWTTQFPSSVYSQTNQSGKISLTFTNNKMVVGKNWRHTDFAITPWRFFDSLAGIEFVSSMNYYQALQPGGENSEISGRSVYMRRCQYCHGVGDFGAKFGPNFATLLPEDKNAAIEMIMKKVLPDEKAYKDGAPAPSRMPKQSDFKKSDAKDLVDWLRAWKKSSKK